MTNNGDNGNGGNGNGEEDPWDPDNSPENPGYNVAEKAETPEQSEGDTVELETSSDDSSSGDESEE